MEDFYPIQILDCNISSNPGLAQSFTELRAFTHKSQRVIVKVDFVAEIG